MYPLVSVIIPTFNYGRYISLAIESLQKQSYPVEHIEIIVVDDGSTDNTLEVLEPFIEKKVIRYYYQTNKGKASSTRHAIKKSNGKYIFNLDADDYYLPDKIANSVKLFEAYEKLVHVGSSAKIFYQETESWGVEKLPSDIVGRVMNGNWLLQRFYKNNIHYGAGSTYAARACNLKAIEIPDAVDMYIDEFLLLSVLPFGESYLIEEPQSVWRVHSNNYSGQSSGIDSQIKKAERLLYSSTAVLDYLEHNNYSDWLVKIYRLRDAIRKIAFKEMVNTKNATDIYRFVNHVFFTIKPGWRVFQKYDGLNRLIPTNLLQFLKKMKKVALKNHNITPLNR